MQVNTVIIGYLFQALEKRENIKNETLKDTKSLMMKIVHAKKLFIYIKYASNY